MLKIGKRIFVVDLDGKTVATGVITGHGFQAQDHTDDDGVTTLSTEPVYLVRTDSGFTAPDGSIYISTIVVHPDAVYAHDGDPS